MSGFETVASRSFEGESVHFSSNRSSPVSMLQEDRREDDDEPQANGIKRHR